jgi:hypothetical protein
MPGTRPGMTIETVFINTLLAIVALPPYFGAGNSTRAKKSSENINLKN